MSDYTEHLISMAGGDGDVLDQIQRRADKVAEWRKHFHSPQSSIDYSQRDVPTLLAVVREQQARLAVVAELANWSAKHGWKLDAAALRAALEPTP